MARTSKKTYDIVHFIRCRIRYRMSNIQYRIRYRMFFYIRYRYVRYTISYVWHTMSYTISIFYVQNPTSYKISYVQNPTSYKISYVFSNGLCYPQALHLSRLLLQAMLGTIHLGIVATSAILLSISLQEAKNVSPPPNRAACALLDRWKTRPHI